MGRTGVGLAAVGEREETRRPEPGPVSSHLGGELDPDKSEKDKSEKPKTPWCLPFPRPLYPRDLCPESSASFRTRRNRTRTAERTS